MDTRIAENVAAIRARMAEAARRAGRRPEEVLLVAATKTQNADAVRAAVAAGIDASGENRVQELVEKSAGNAYAGAPVHFIGHLQRNKLKLVVGRADLIESVDSEELLRLIDARAHELGITQDVLLEVNIGGEASKTGLTPESLPQILEAVGDLSSVFCRGLMAIPPIALAAGENRPYFDRMYKLFVDNRAKKYDNVSMDFLSMGMSGDFEDAITCGANMVRVGTAIFGPRSYAH
jgi:pyridoxal phosphate enzyme (YggS family)